MQIIIIELNKVEHRKEETKLKPCIINPIIGCDKNQQRKRVKVR